MKDAIRKADILIEALPYIRTFKDKIFVIKYGGSTMTHTDEVHSILEDIVFMHSVGILPIIVHGGGHIISSAVRKLGKKPVFIDGFRKTDEDIIGVVEEVLTKVNGAIVNDIESLGAKARGLTNRDAKVVKAVQIKKELGYVGRIEQISREPIQEVLSKDMIPVISPVGIDSNSHAMNINADEAAAHIAEAIGAEKLMLMTNVRGILSDPNDEDTFYSTLTVKEALRLKERNIIDGGMIPKVNAAIHAVKAGVRKVHIVDGGISRSLLLEIFTKKGIGTEIVA